VIDILKDGRFVESTDTDNATAIATVAAIAGVRHFLGSIQADYSAAPAAGFKTIVVKYGTTTIRTIRWSPTLEMPFRIVFATELPHGDNGQQISVELGASGTGGVTGRVGVVVSSA
jgi:hypothetical protein